MQNPKKIIGTQVLIDSIQRELSNEYQEDKV